MHRTRVRLARTLLMLRQLGRKRGETCLDLGTGYGPFAWMLRRRYDALHGLDLNEEVVEKATQRGYTMQVGLLRDLPELYPEHRFDLVFSRHVLEHVPDIETVLAHIHDLTEPNGWSLHAVPMPPYTDPVHVTELWPHEWARAFQAAGFVVYESREVHLPILGHREIHIKARRPA